MTSPEGIHDYDAFTFRINKTNEEIPSTDHLQSIAVTSYGEIHLMSLNQSFVESFYRDEPILGLNSADDSASDKDDINS